MPTSPDMPAAAVPVTAELLRAAVAEIRAGHEACSTERGACPWPNFTDREADELLAALSASDPYEDDPLVAAPGFGVTNREYVPRSWVAAMEAEELEEGASMQASSDETAGEAPNLGAAASTTEPTIPLRALDAISRGEPRDEVAADYDVAREVVDATQLIIGATSMRTYQALGLGTPGAARRVGGYLASSVAAAIETASAEVGAPAEPTGDPAAAIGRALLDYSTQVGMPDAIRNVERVVNDLARQAEQ